MVVTCDQCNSERTILRRERFNTLYAVIGAALAGFIGLAAGLLGRNRLVAQCRQCGNSWRLVIERHRPD